MGFSPTREQQNKSSVANVIQEYRDLSQPDRYMNMAV